MAYSKTMPDKVAAPKRRAHATAGPGASAGLAQFGSNANRAAELGLAGRAHDDDVYKYAQAKGSPDTNSDYVYKYALAKGSPDTNGDDVYKYARAKGYPSIDDDDVDEYARAKGSPDIDDDVDEYIEHLEAGDELDAAAPADPAVAARNQNWNAYHAAAGPGKLATTPLLAEYAGEDVGAEAPNNHLPKRMHDVNTPTTRYASGPEAHQATVENGQLKRADGAVADSSDAKRLWRKDKDARFNYAMDAHGKTYLSDPKAEFEAGRQAALANGTDAQRINHSTMVAGGDVAGAGTARLRAGKVETISDSSGHYQPKVAHTAQVVETLAEQGVLDPARATVELTERDSVWAMVHPEIQLSAQELLSYGEGKDNPMEKARRRHDNTGYASALDDPFQQISARHQKKRAALAELKGKVKPIE